MRFLADENCDFRVVTALRNAGHDVVAVAETARGASDVQVLEMAHGGKRVLITEDRDFGQLVFADYAPAMGVLYLRCPESSRPALPAMMVPLVTRLGSQLEHSFTVWTPKRV